MNIDYKRDHYSIVVLFAGIAVIVTGAAVHSLIIGGCGVVLMVAACLLQLWGE